MNWSGTAFVANPQNVALDVLPPWITTLAVQVAWGLSPLDLGDFPERCLGRYYLAAWAWCNGDDVEAEAELHGRLASAGYVAYIANCEEPYDAHGDQTSPRWTMPSRYLAALDYDGPLGITTTPHFGSDTAAWRDRGAVYMPQAFPLENGVDVTTAVLWGTDWGWRPESQRPLAQCYTTASVRVQGRLQPRAFAPRSAQRPDGAQMDAQATAVGVGLVPYVVEQATDPDGQTWLAQTRPSVERPTEPTTENGGGNVAPDWWETPYALADKPAYAGKMPRPLYPPDSAAKGKRPSVDGPDVVAVKRTVSRLGRWPWQAFDDSYSNAFSHGKSGNVADTGVEGVQRQQHIDATGWIGQKTFDVLVRAIVATGPHAGELACDAYAASLLAQAWDRFQGSEPAPIEQTVRQQALSIAIREIGYSENPPESNLTKYGAWYGMDGQPWCAMFATWAYEQIGSPSFKKGTNYAYCPYVVSDARAGRNGLRTTDDPIPGDLVVYDWSGDTIYDHIGLFEKWTSSTRFQAIEGNTSTSNNSNGGQVMRRDRDRTAQGTVFVRVAEP